jgi:hypothetical protein
MFENRISQWLPGEGEAPAAAWAANPWAPPVKPENAATTDIFAAAWTQSQRDYELDRLFNASFYYEI